MNGISFTRQLLDWYDANGRNLPWRQRPEPYAVWVSEIMAQQTQIDRVVDYHARWMQRFPDIPALANASEDEVLNLWEGLGYYTRARNMHKTAILIQAEFGGIFPSDFADIRSLPGVGDYTAGAVASIAFGQSEPAVDANVLRVFARLLDVAESVRDKAGRNPIEKQVRRLIPDDRPGDFNQAVMELGALVCRKSPHCGRCPVQDHCQALGAGTVALRPVLPASREILRINMATGVLVHQGRMLIQKRKPGDVWPGLWEFPGGGIEEGETPEQAVVREFMEEVELTVRPVEKITVIKYNYTRYRVTMHCFLCRVIGNEAQPVFNEAVEGGFMAPDDLKNFAFPSGHRKLAVFMQSDDRFASLFPAF
ncbi:MULTISPECIES: A/G-specific adenine glycosylase [unclassified Pseudodesulfovibrio]|uniref:A/G-specific adenine glycosylase n=1 Tax=unclassified Pseudodesulfovibrio TaxID=2661612 RepID=UPI000FEB9E2B|nr:MULTISPECIES: A/G-specific adenine glycosylase [unclassified Pseudodesulfovibrio]MCJ2164094.1 A/G-specific adenine glycosylase [Pseudodesulfovibrio sp. S3-i]RWU05275.1 A/G-specific adenine glycosylase [Pseudodesulfovibrio sp. S3]